MSDTLRVAKLEDVQGKHPLSETVASPKTVAEALKLIETAAVVRIILLVYVADGRATHIETTKDFALAGLRRVRGGTEIKRDLDADGWCWIGEGR